MVNPDTKEVVLSYRDTQLNSKKNRWKDLASDLAIATGTESLINGHLGTNSLPSTVHLGTNSRTRVILWADKCPSM